LDRVAPELTSSAWINSEPKSLNDLRGKVVLVEFWTFGCYNCRNVEPQIKKWHQNYAGQGLVVIGVHSPELSYEKDIDSVRRYVKEHGIQYAVAIDNDFAIWDRYENHYWPAIYLIDKIGVIRYIRIGEGGYTETEKMIKRLLTEPR
ncbi:MAG: redoxin domain-containing protein, partial [Nitrospira sp.]|nr:redoxin domain-containing protein [Nitrospira sp.]